VGTAGAPAFNFIIIVVIYVYNTFCVYISCMTVSCNQLRNKINKQHMQYKKSTSGMVKITTYMGEFDMAKSAIHRDIFAIFLNPIIG
jgi:hypothetical protein